MVVPPIAASRLVAAPVSEVAVPTSFVLAICTPFIVLVFGRATVPVKVGDASGARPVVEGACTKFVAVPPAFVETSMKSVTSWLMEVGPFNFRRLAVVTSFVLAMDTPLIVLELGKIFVDLILPELDPMGAQMRCDNIQRSTLVR